jgi:hypothetical protein
LRKIKTSNSVKTPTLVVAYAETIVSYAKALATGQIPGRKGRGRLWA